MSFLLDQIKKIYMLVVDSIKQKDPSVTTMDNLADQFSKATITHDWEKIKLVNCNDFLTYCKKVPLGLREFDTQAADFSSVDMMLTKKCNFIARFDLSYTKALENHVFSSTTFSNTGEPISTLNDQFSGATDFVALPLNKLSMYPEVKECLFKASKAFENDAFSSTTFSNTGEPISILNDQFSGATDFVAFTIDPETTSKLIKVAELLYQVPPIA